MAKLPLTTPLLTLGDINKAKEYIFSQLTETELFVTDKSEFCFNTLKHFDFLELDKNNLASIEDAAKQIIYFMGMEKSALESIGIQDDARLFDPLNRYMHYFLDFDTLPGEEKKLLDNMVSDDLNQINTWISDYETKHTFLVAGETPRNHAQRTIKDFYTRCINEKNTIIDYQTNGLNKRAIARAQRFKEWGTVMAMFQDYYDRPYRLPIPKSTNFFKHESIDLVSHRLGTLTIKEGLGLKALYASDKKAFYTAVEAKLPASKLLAFLVSAINWLPNVNPKRVEVFTELNTLYNAGNYWGFYALGIPQIEGLFLDMCNLCIPNFSHPYAALPDKVNEIRPYYKRSEQILDYFQYHVPNQRNPFLHYGTQDKENVKDLCNDLLFDLVETMEIFCALDTDSIWLNRLVKNNDITEFSTVGHFTFYFDLIAKAKQKNQYSYFEAQINSLNNSFFPDLVLGLAFELDKNINELKDKINHAFSGIPLSNTFVVNLDTTTNQQIKDNDIIIAAELKEFIEWHLKDEFIEVFDISKFLSTYKNNLNEATLDPEMVKDLDSIHAKYKEVFSKIRQLSVVIKLVK